MSYLYEHVMVNKGNIRFKGKVVEETDDKVCVKDFLDERHWFDKENIRPVSRKKKGKLK